MENAEEVMQLLEEFSKIKPKEIPRELEDYLGYVAKTGDPVYQWSLVRSLFREKLLNVITDFYESTLTVDLPPCPNVDPFNYERMKSSLLERFDMFSSAPFTIQRICELLTNPRKEYNRADKYMRAIEKNILVVSTREPGTGKRSLECDNQSETVLNGMPDVKLSDSDGTLLHVPTDLPYLGAPPASNDVTVETTEPNTTINDRMGLDINVEAKKLKLDIEKPWSSQDSTSATSEDKQIATRIETLNTEVSLSTEEKRPKESDCDTNDRLANIESTNENSENLGEGSSKTFVTQTSETVRPDSIDSSDSSHESKLREVLSETKLEDSETGNMSDENEVSSTPADAAGDVPLVQGEVEEPTDSEAEATNTTSLMQDTESEKNSLPDSEINSSDGLIEVSETEKIIISEVTATKSDEVDLKCNEITATVDSPGSPENDRPLHTENVEEENINPTVIEEAEHTDSHPDSSNDICSQNKLMDLAEAQQPETCAEADSVSETNIAVLDEPSKSDSPENIPDQTNNEIVTDNDVFQVSTHEVCKISDKDLEKPVEEPLQTSNSPVEIEVSEGNCSYSMIEESIKLTEVQSTSEITDEIRDQERIEGSIIQSTPNVTPDSQQQMTTIEEINVDPSCEAEEEAMDVDDSSNQMMVSEGENEGEPMDQCDQSQS